MKVRSSCDSATPLLERRRLLGLGVLGLAALATTGSAFFVSGRERQPLVTYPDPLLRKPAAPVAGIDDSVFSLAARLRATLQYQTLLSALTLVLPQGLSAPQIGVSKRLVVCGLFGGATVMVNPEILWRSGEYLSDEVCLSLPNHDSIKIRRPAQLTLRYLGLDNVERVILAKNGYAALLEHEIDHLNGVLYIDHVVNSES